MKVGELRKYKDSLNAAQSRDLAEFEKNFFLIAVGLLAFSITFIKEVVTISEALMFFLLPLSWLLICISIGIMLYAFLYSSNSCNNLWKLSDDYLLTKKLYKDDVEFTDEEYESIKKTLNEQQLTSKLSLKNRRFAAIGFFLAGIVFFAIFVGINLYDEKTQAPPKNLNRVQVTAKNRQMIIEADSVKININDSVIISTH